MSRMGHIGGDLNHSVTAEGLDAAHRLPRPWLHSVYMSAPHYEAFNARKDVDARRMTARPLVGLRVVVVDDDRVSLLAISSMVKAWGAQVRSAASGAEALRLIHEDAPDLVLSDLYMPEMDGFDLMRRVREMPAAAGGGTPGIAITAHPSFDSRRDADRVGFGAVFPKPFGREELIETILRLAAKP